MEPIKDVLQRIVSDAPLKRPGPLSVAASEMDENTCVLCRGAGFVHPLRNDGRPDYSTTVPCDCVRAQLEQARLDWMVRLCELPSGSEHMTFENFRMRPGLDDAYGECLSLADGTAEYSFLTLWSDTGRGKTHLGIATVRRWLMRRVPARYAYVPLLLDELRRGFRAEGEMSYESRFDFYLNVPLLMLDDLGTENPTRWVQEKLDTIIDHRLMNKLKTLVTTNLTMDEMNFRIASRLQRDGKVVVIDVPEFE